MAKDKNIQSTLEHLQEVARVGDMIFETDKESRQKAKNAERTEKMREEREKNSGLTKTSKPNTTTFRSMTQTQAYIAWRAPKKREQLGRKQKADGIYGT